MKITLFVKTHANYNKKIYLFYISQTKSSLDKIFYKIVYHRIIYMCVFFINLDDFFVVICTSFHECLVSTRYVLFK